MGERVLTENDIEVIRERFHGWEKASASTLAAVFGVSVQRITAIARPDPHQRKEHVMATEPRTYRGWNVNYDYPPIPIRSADWSATSPDYDVDCDEDGFHVCAGQQVHAATYEALCAEIDAAIEESE